MYHFNTFIVLLGLLVCVNNEFLLLFIVSLYIVLILVIVNDVLFDQLINIAYTLKFIT